MIRVDFLTPRLIRPESKIISSVVLSPAASSVFSNGAFVHLQPGLTFRILRVSPPMFLIQKVCETRLCCGVLPKFQKVSESQIFGGPALVRDKENIALMVITTARAKPRTIHLVVLGFMGCFCAFPSFFVFLRTFDAYCPFIQMA
jgi:hypothetical protein